MKDPQGEGTIDKINQELTHLYICILEKYIGSQWAFGLTCPRLVGRAI